MNTVSEQSFEKALDRIRELSRSNTELLEALENIAERLNSRLWDDEDLIASTKAVATEAIRKAGR